MLRNFKTKELECPCCQRLVFDKKMATRLQALRDVCDFPLTITSGYRCPQHNSNIKNAADGSLHIQGKAVDIRIFNFSDNKKHQLLKNAFMVGFSGVGVYKNHIHLDLRERPRLWIN